MKRSTWLSVDVICLAIATVLCAASSVSAVLPPVGYIGLFKDATHDTSPISGGSGFNVCPAQYEQFQCWIWCLPSVNGMQGASFAVSFPATTVTLTTVKNPGITVELGTLAGGYDFMFAQGNCQMDWFWTHHLTMMSLASPAVSAKIEIIPNPGGQPVPELVFAPCGVAHYLLPFTCLTPLYICWTPDPGPLGVEETSWGAIKSLF
ncbi:MAG: hypothetical protein NTW97_00745 [Candidatus Krumholzibacteria bacterium]|nr:hypothetical protein [Candidatus Krumholzibacteria bacterium]